MYSPKIREDLIPILYRKAKKQSKPMTKIVDRILRQNIKEADPIDEKEVSTQEKRQIARWLRALEIAKVIFYFEGYHTFYLEQIETFIKDKKNS